MNALTSNAAPDSGTAGATPGAPVIPDNAPFSAAQRAWLNGFLAGLYGPTNAGPVSLAAPPAAAEPAEEFPWHDPALALQERLDLAAGRPMRRRLMAAMAQLDCGQCGYLCQTYAEALADGRETSFSLCVPGAKQTSKALKVLFAEAPAPVVAFAADPGAAASGPAAVAAPAKPVGKPVRVLSAAPLTRRGSAKDVRHVVIDLAGSGLSYQPGDSVGIAAHNATALVTACIDALGASESTPVGCPDGVTRSLREAFTSHLDIARPLDRTLDLLAVAATHPAHQAALRRLAEGEDDVAPQDADLLDLLLAFASARPAPADLARSLPALKPRLYSIASSPLGAPGQVHLCVSHVREARRGRLRAGVASGFLAAHATDHGDILAHIQASPFRLPADSGTPVIMVGPGTGIAPFRAFLQHRAAQGTRDRSWLFFGDQHRATDFLYEDELTGWLRDGTLGRLDLAFSRDQPRKVYVQDRMLESAPDLWRWLQDGGYFYVCGDATRMARDVDAALRQVAISEGRMDAAQAKDWIVALTRQGRYLRDVY